MEDRIGPIGPEGPRGNQGPQGEQGPQGDVGPRGERGLQGPQGLQGVQGPQGELGPQGETGPQGIQGIQGVDGTQGEIGPTGPQGPVAATIPFSIGKYGINLTTDAQGQPQNIAFSGFSASGYYNPEYLQEGDWENRRIVVTENMDYGPAFVMPYDGKLRNIYVVFSLESPQAFEENVIITPFLCLAISNSDELVYSIPEDTIITGDPFVGGTTYRRHTLRKAEKAGLDIDLPAGTLVGIVMGIMAENAGESQYCSLAVSGGLYLQ